jgi:hypothetical protein
MHVAGDRKKAERDSSRVSYLRPAARSGGSHRRPNMVLSASTMSLKTYLRELGLTPMSRRSLDVPVSQSSVGISPVKLLELKQACWKAGVVVDFASPDFDLEVSPEISDEVMEGGSLI